MSLRNQHERFLDGKAPELHQNTVEESYSNHELVSLNAHSHNATGRAMRSLKDFLRALASANLKCPKSMWDKLTQKVVIALNLLRKMKAHPHLSAWAH